MVDTHCHLDSCKPPDAELVERAAAAGVRRLATVGMDSPTIERALEAAHEHEEVVAIVGRHPHNAEGFTDADAESIEAFAADPRALETSRRTFACPTERSWLCSAKNWRRRSVGATVHRCR